MAYSTSNPPSLVTASFTNSDVESSAWTYISTDSAADVDSDGYFTNGKTLGMKVGDSVLVQDSDASPVAITLHRVTSVSATDDSVDVSNGGILTAGTDSD